MTLLGLDVSSFLTLTPLMKTMLVVIVTYIIGVQFIPKHYIFESTKYTRNQLQRLAQQGASVQPNIEESLLRDQYKSTGGFARAFYMLPFAKSAQAIIVRAGLAESINKLFLIGIAAFIVGLALFKQQGFLSLLYALILSYVVVWRVIDRAAKKRTKLFLSDFPDALDMIVRSVRSGFPLNAAVNMVAESMTGPVAEEFKQVSDEVMFGTTLVEALYRLSQRIKTPDVRFFAVVLTLQQDVGGNLAEVLENLAGLIRKRKTLRQKIQAMTAEGKATMWVLGGLPIFVACVIHLLSPDHLKPLFEVPMGQYILGLAILLIVVGVGIVRKMVNMEI